MTVPACLNAALFGGRGNIQFVGSQVGGAFTAGSLHTFSLTGGLASVPAAGDLVIVAFSAAGTADLTLEIVESPGSTPYTLLGAELYANDTYDTNLRVAYRFMPAPPETQFILGSGVNATHAYTAHVFRGVNAVTPIDVTTTTNTGINSYLVDPPAITPVTNDAWIYVAGGGAAATAGTYSSSDLSNFAATSIASTNDSAVGAGYQAWIGGAFDPVVWTNSVGDNVANSWAAVTVALRPA